MADVTEKVFIGALVSYPGAWSFQLGKSVIILVSDKELNALANPDTVLNLSLGFQKEEGSLRSVCDKAQAAGHNTLIVAFDHFFSQYRPGQEGPRKFTPDMDAYVKRIAAVSKFAQGYGLGLELSLLSPLEIGPGYVNQTGEAGLWLHYRKGVREPSTGTFSVQLWQQKRWANNKGIIELKDSGVRVFAFQETNIPGTHYKTVDPNSIVEITGTAKVERYTRSALDASVTRIRVYGKGQTEIGDRNRVLVVQQYKTPEMDYFSENALPFLKVLVDKYADAGVKLNALYSDEMHIQQDWNYFGHHDNGTFALRYVSPGLSKRFAAKYGAEYADLAKYMVYFCTGQEDTATDLSAKADGSHVFGVTPEAIRQTALFRARYYHLLQNGVTDLFTEAKHHAEKRMGHKLEARAHATWAESPTVDKWDTGEENMYRNGYEYTSNFLWSNTVHQAASACYDYFKWGDFLTGNGNDHCEIGWLDRNYVGLSLACSTGILNEIPYSYAAHWGMPSELHRRRTSLVNTYGAAGSPLYGMVQEMEHRDVEVLMLYPMDLVALEERFGSWMAQYGYANLITQDKLLEQGQVINGGIVLGGRRFTTLVATFEPFPSESLLTLMDAFAAGGGCVIWSGPPPLLSAEGIPILETWQKLFGVEYTHALNEGKMAPGRQVEFVGHLDGLPSQTILTDLLVDHIYPVSPHAGVQTIATTKGGVVGTLKKRENGGSVSFLGFRPRDDQSKSLGYEARWWFEILHRFGSYPGTGHFSGMNDNSEYLSRTTDYLACHFPNGAIALCRHFRETEEDWVGGFSRNETDDATYLNRVPPPSEAIEITDFQVHGHTVTYNGQKAVTFRVDSTGCLLAFAGSQCQKITVNGKETIFADSDIEEVGWAPIPEARRVAGGAVMQIMVNGTGTLHIPMGSVTSTAQLFVEGVQPGSKGAKIPCTLEDGSLVFTATMETKGRWLYATE